MRPIYLDNAASAWPTPQSVVDEVVRAYGIGGNPGRGAHAMAVEKSREVYRVRRETARLFGALHDRDILFQPGATQAMNLVLFGFLRPGMRVLVSSVEHNSVTRPLHRLSQLGVEVDEIPVDDWGTVHVEWVEQYLRRERVDAIVCQQGSNVSGALQPVADLADLAHEVGARMIVDGAQAGGHIEIDLVALGIDAWACSGHKGLMGPQGIGILYLDPSLDVEPLTYGGTGSGDAMSPADPHERPDAYEAGTQSFALTLGLGAAVKLHAEKGEELRATESRLARRLFRGLSDIPGIRILGPTDPEARLPLVSIVCDAVAPDRLAFELDKRYGIATRSGLHCSPSAHAQLGTLETGAVRFGVGPHNTEEEIDTAIEAVATLSREG